ncbi:hypothetical protein LSTR_LSTR005670 [Laodelphax striatellus]|uniref:Charged multivesicular body protein 2a n=1 Tax=Laodelphax striatellus TaxID=195883 RepID=A0A482X898_LAOST|nr:hypothetical protein LSTR_LSTR005670 [Laodelphax striatellus]
MEWLFGRRITPEEMLRNNQRALNRAMRDLDRERARMEQQEKKIIADIKKMAKEGQMDSVKIMAKDLVRTRKYVKKFMLMKANVQAVSLKIQTLRSQNAMAQAMKGVTKAMQNMNRQMNLPQIQRILQEFEKQSEMMDMKEEVMNDAIDDAMEDEGDEEESEAVVAQVLDELGLQLTEQLGGLPEANNSLSIASGKTPVAAAAAAGGGGGGGAGGGANGGGGGGTISDADADLQARLDNLRRE